MIFDTSSIAGWAVGDGVGLTDGTAVGTAEELALGAGFATGINTPLFHTNFLPLFTQV